MVMEVRAWKTISQASNQPQNGRQSTFSLLTKTHAIFIFCPSDSVKLHHNTSDNDRRYNGHIEKINLCVEVN